MKKRIAFLVVAALLLSCTVLPALGENGYEVCETTGQDIVMNSYSNIFAVKASSLYKADSTYVFMDAKGNVLSDQAYAEVKTNGAFFEVSNSSDMNKTGLVDKTGTLIVPMEYEDFYIPSDSGRWVIAIRLTPTNTDQGDYKYTNYTQNTVAYYNIDVVDVYYRGTKVGSLDRSGYADYGATAYGDYLQIKDRNNVYHHYSPDFVESEIHESGEYAYSNRQYIHTGTGQPMYTESCTLTPDSVSSPYMESNGYVIDLQGKQLFAFNYSYINSFEGEYARFKTNQGKYGVIDIRGNEIIRAEYEDLDYDLSTLESVGYLAVEKNGLAGFASADGDAEGTFLYPESALRTKTPFYYATGLDGKYLVISATAGELRQHFDDVRFYDSGCPIFVGKVDGKASVYGVDGEPFITNDAWDDVYDISLSYDGKVGYTYSRSNGVYTYWLFDIHYDLPVRQPSNNSKEQTEAPASDGSWVCPTCGQEVTSPFCPNDGTKKPDSHWVCPVCNSELDTPFCPNDGTPRP